MRIIPGIFPLRANVSKNFLTVLQWFSGLTALCFVGWQLYQMPATALSQWLQHTSHPVLTASLAIGCLLLMAANWGLEALKWKTLATLLEPVGFGKALRGVLYGISLGMITPKRSGEFAGRIMMLSPANHLQGMLLNTAASMSQLFVTLAMGSAGMLVFLFLLHGNWQSEGFSFARNSQYFLLPGLAFAAIILLAIYRIPRIVYRAASSGGVAGVVNHCLDAFAMLQPRHISQLLLLSIARYFIFLLQFYLLLSMLGLSLAPLTFFALTAIKYLVLTLFPLSAIWELGIRGSVALFVFGLYLPDEPMWQASVAAATVALWVINLALPALAGGISGLAANLQKQPEA